jgi:putative membrane protein
MLISETEEQDISRLITSIEQQTDAELVCVLAAQSDDYHYVPPLLAALCALLSPAIVWFTPWWAHSYEVVIVQAVVFLTSWILLSLPGTRMIFTPKSLRFWHASNIARRAFLENRLHHTQGHTGVLLFISEAEHYVEILADHGIAKHIEQQRWQQMVDQLIADIKQRRTQAGILTCLTRCGELLKQHVPLTQDKNELPNRLVIWK